jgi:hypothetical protein
MLAQTVWMQKREITATIGLHSSVLEDALKTEARRAQPWPTTTNTLQGMFLLISSTPHTHLVDERPVVARHAQHGLCSHQRSMACHAQQQRTHLVHECPVVARHAQHVIHQHVRGHCSHLHAVRDDVCARHGSLRAAKGVAGGS